MKFFEVSNFQKCLIYEIIKFSPQISILWPKSEFPKLQKFQNSGILKISKKCPILKIIQVI